MKKLIFATLSALTLIGPLSAPVAAADTQQGDIAKDRHDRDWRRDRSEWRDERRDARWDAQRHDGYWLNNRWYYGPPPRNYDRRGVVFGYRPWERGAALPRYYFDRQYYVDYRRYRLREPPRGYYWVRDERGDFVLAALATGLIADIIVNSR